MKRTLFVVLSIVIISCHNNPVNPISEEVPDVIMPLKLGNWWYYYYTGFDSVGRINWTFFDTVRNQSKEQVGGEEWFSVNPMELSFDDSAGSVIGYHGDFFTNRSDGLWKKSQFSSNPNRLFAKYPTTASVAFDSGAIVLAVDTLKTVPAGLFKSYRYRHNKPTFSGGILKTFFFDLYFAPKVGPIYSEFHFKTRSGTSFLGIKVELLSYQVN